METQIPVQPTVPVQTEQRHSRLVIIIMALIIFMGIGIGIYYMVNKQNNGNETERLANTGLELFCNGVKYHAGTSDESGNSNLSDKEDNLRDQNQTEILKKYDFKNIEAYGVILDKYQKDSKLSVELQNIMGSSEYQKKYMDCMSQNLSTEK